MLDEVTLFFDPVPVGSEDVQSPVGDAVGDDGNPSAAPREGAGCSAAWQAQRTLYQEETQAAQLRLRHWHAVRHFKLSSARVDFALGPADQGIP